MDGQLRAYAWVHALASRMSLNGMPVEHAAKDADAALKEFDARTFEPTSPRVVAENEALGLRVKALEAELAQVQAEVIAPNPAAVAISAEVASKVAFFDQLHEVLGPLALPNETDVEVAERLAKLL